MGVSKHRKPEAGRKGTGRGDTQRRPGRSRSPGRGAFSFWVWWALWSRTPVWRLFPSAFVFLLMRDQRDPFMTQRRRFSFTSGVTGPLSSRGTPEFLKLGEVTVLLE